MAFVRNALLVCCTLFSEGLFASDVAVQNIEFGVKPSQFSSPLGVTLSRSDSKVAVLKWLAVIVRYATKRAKENQAKHH